MKKFFTDYLERVSRLALLLFFFEMCFMLNVKAQTNFDFKFSFNKFQLYNSERLTITPVMNYSKSPHGAAFVKVSYFWDGDLISTETQSPFNLDYLLQNKSIGKHTLKVAVYATGTNLPTFGPFNFEYAVTVLGSSDVDASVVENNPAKALELGNKYYNADGVALDYEKAVFWYQKAAEQGNADAMLQLALCYRKGHGVDGDQEECVKWLKKSAEKGVAKAQYYLASYYEEGEGGLSKDSVAAYQWYTKAAQQGDIYSMVSLGESYLTFKQIEGAKDAAIEWLKKVSAGQFKGKPDEIDEISMSSCDFLLYYLYQGNEGVKRNEPLSMQFLKKAVSYKNNPDPEAMAQMGICYMEGIGVVKDVKVGVEWLQKSADKNCGTGQAHLGEYYYKQGKYDVAIDLLRHAVGECPEGGDALDYYQFWPSSKAMRLLAACYRYGLGTKIDKEKEAYWMEEAKNHKDEQAMRIMNQSLK